MVEEDVKPRSYGYYEKKEKKKAKKMEAEATARVDNRDDDADVDRIDKRSRLIERAELSLRKHFRNFISEEMDDLSFYYYDEVMNDWLEGYLENPIPWRASMNRLTHEMGKYFNKNGTLRKLYADQKIVADGWEL